MLPQLIKNFINKETSIYIKNYIKESNLLDQDGKVVIYVNKSDEHNSITGFDPNMFTLFEHLDKNGQKDSLIYELLNLISHKMSHVFDFKSSDFALESVGVKILTPGIEYQSMDMHRDNYGDRGTIYTALLYLDEDFEGGELVTYQDNIMNEQYAILNKPSTGDLFYFDGQTPHAVRSVTSGERSNIMLHIRSHKTWENSNKVVD